MLPVLFELRFPVETALVNAGFFLDKHPRVNSEIDGDRAFKQVRVQHTEDRFYSVFSHVAEW